MTTKKTIERAVKVEGGTLYQEGGPVRVVWDLHGPETWSLPETAWGIAEATRNFDDMADRWAEDKSLSADRPGSVLNGILNSKKRRI